jgi:hypothetical protein
LPHAHNKKGVIPESLAVQFISIKEAGFNRKATRGGSRAVAFLFDVF